MGGSDISDDNGSLKSSGQLKYTEADVILI